MKVYNSIMKGLNEAVEHEKGSLRDVKVERITIEIVPRYGEREIKQIRKNTVQPYSKNLS
jgi:hypothetical protein